MRTLAHARASTTLINPDDDSAGEVTRANRCFCVSHLASDWPARLSRGHGWKQICSLLLAPLSPKPCYYSVSC